jgi:hypothetical protein
MRLIWTTPYISDIVSLICLQGHALDSCQFSQIRTWQMESSNYPQITHLHNFQPSMTDWQMPRRYIYAYNGGSP